METKTNKIKRSCPKCVAGELVIAVPPRDSANGIERCTDCRTVVLMDDQPSAPTHMHTHVGT